MTRLQLYGDECFKIRETKPDCAWIALLSDAVIITLKI